MPFYKAFGLCVESEIVLPQFISTENRKADVSIRYGDVNTFLPSGEGIERATQLSEEEIGFYFEQTGSFLVRHGQEIVVDPYVGAEDQLIRLPLIGIVMAALLHQRGKLVLHASAVAVNNGVVVFLGWKGAGKSTTSAMMYGRGHSMLSDDIVAIEDAGSASPFVEPGFPFFKLAPETAASVLGDDPETLAKVCTGLEKRFRPSSDNFLKTRLPLRAIYVIEDGENVQAHQLLPQQATFSLIANTYLARYGRQLLQNDHAVANLRQCSNIVNQVPVYSLQRPRSMHLLDDLANLIESQCEKDLLSP